MEPKPSSDKASRWNEPWKGWCRPVGRRPSGGFPGGAGCCSSLPNDSRFITRQIHLGRLFCWGFLPQLAVPGRILSWRLESSATGVFLSYRQGWQRLPLRWQLGGFWRKVWLIKKQKQNTENNLSQTQRHRSVCSVQETASGFLWLSTFCKMKLKKLCGTMVGIYYDFCLASTPLLLETAPWFSFRKNYPALLSAHVTGSWLGNAMNTIQRSLSCIF